MACRNGAVGPAQDPQATQNLCGSGLARECGVSVNIDFG